MRVVIIMAKEPRMGRVKTRLARDIGGVAATHAFRAMLAQLTARLSAPHRWQLLLAVAPDDAIGRGIFPASVARIGQGGGDLGQRLMSVVRRGQGYSLGHSSRTFGTRDVIVIGADAPAILPDDLAQGFAALGHSDVVLGPSDDGGFWLVGIGRRINAATLFNTVRWSSDKTLSDVVANCATPPALLRTLTDCDDADTFRRLGARIGRRVPPL